MRLGITAFCSNNGLSNQTLQYYRQLLPTKTLLLDISMLNHQPVYPERYTTNPIGEVTIVKGFPRPVDIDKFMEDLDVLLVAETPLEHYMFQSARNHGVKSIMAANVEFIDYFEKRYSSWAKPDVLWMPSLWHWHDMQYVAHEWGCQIKHMPMPVDREKFPFKPRKHAKRFLHIAGHKTTEDRNGTELVREAIKHVKSQDVEFIIRTQNPEIQGVGNDRRVKTIKEDVRENISLFNDEDVLLLPRRYGGLSLQLDEAMSLGMVPIMSNQEPQNLFLPFDCLLQCRLRTIIPTRTPIGVYDIDPVELAARIDNLANRDITDLSHHMNEIAEDRSWRVWKDKYIAELENICND